MINQDKPRIAAASLTLKKPVDFGQRLKRLHVACAAGGNKNDSAVALITACIEEGIDTRARIIGALEPLGFDYRHVAIQLQRGTGTNAAQDRWRLDPDGRYHLNS